MQIELMIGNRIREFRRSRRFKLEELAKASGISNALLSKIENAKVGSPISVYSRIATALGVKFSDLFPDEEKKGGCVVLRKSERKRVLVGKRVNGYQFEAQGHRWPNTNFNPFVLTYLPQTKKPVFQTLPLRAKNSFFSWKES